MRPHGLFYPRQDRHGAMAAEPWDLGFSTNGIFHQWDVDGCKTNGRFDTKYTKDNSLKHMPTLLIEKQAVPEEKTGVEHQRQLARTCLSCSIS